mmetsp:Transcript_21531/g.31221  ORF Transcript_21531/g.31221 Transcript_21531/m.31221 type:complete len:86 (-) Transcript_21531:1355-1612(-)
MTPPHHQKDGHTLLRETNVERLQGMHTFYPAHKGALRLLIPDEIFLVFAFLHKPAIASNAIKRHNKLENIKVAGSSTITQILYVS